MNSRAILLAIRIGFLGFIIFLVSCSAEQRRNNPKNDKQKTTKTVSNSAESAQDDGAKLDQESEGSQKEVAEQSDENTKDQGSEDDANNNSSVDKDVEVTAVADEPVSKTIDEDPIQNSEEPAQSEALCPFFDPNNEKSRPTYLHQFTVGGRGTVEIPIFKEDASGKKIYAIGYENDGKAYILRPYAWYNFDFKMWSINEPLNKTHWLYYLWTVKIDNAHLPTCSLNSNLDQAGYLQGCFAANTLLKLANGQTKTVSELKAGDLLINPVKQKAVKVLTTLNPMNIKHDVVTIKYAQNQIILTGNHPVLVKAGIKLAQDVTKADLIVGADSKVYKIDILEKRAVGGNDQFLNIELDMASKDLGDHFVSASGFIAGDFYMQHKLEQKYDSQFEKIIATIPVPSF